MPTRQLYARNWEKTVSAWRVAVFFAWVAPRAESSTRFGANHSDMVGVIAMTLSTNYVRRNRQKGHYSSYLEWTKMSTFQ